MATTTKKKSAKKASKKAASRKSARKRAPKFTDVDVVRATAANPDASRAGAKHVLESSDCPLSVTVIDGARASLELRKHDPLTQAELHVAAKLIASAIQETY